MWQKRERVTFQYPAIIFMNWGLGERRKECKFQADKLEEYFFLWGNSEARSYVEEHRKKKVFRERARLQKISVLSANEHVVGGMTSKEREV